MKDIGDISLAAFSSAVSERYALAKVLKLLCDEIAATELHGDGAHDQDCSVCRAHKRARNLLSRVVGSPRRQT